MPRLTTSLLVFLLFAAHAHAVIKGTVSSHSYTVRLLGKGTYCSGVIIARTAILTAAHCARTIPAVAGRSLAVASISRSAVLDDGRRVTVSGDTVVLRLASPLPAKVAAAPVGEGSGDTYTIAGYGTTDEASRNPVGSPHEAALVAASPGALVDPHRTGSIGASACFGDSGGPVLRGGMLVGIITRASHPSPYVVCGDLTHWVPVIASDAAAGGDASIKEKAVGTEQPRDYARRQPASSNRMQTGAATPFKPFAMVQ
jgi:hypothetical protein